MILYTFKCTGCGYVRDTFAAIADRDKDIQCSWCDNVMVRQFSTPGIVIK